MTPHEILGITPDTVADDEIKAAYRRAASKAHPDKGGSSEAFRAVVDAYEAIMKRPCQDCKGTGQITTRQGFFVNREPCPKCWRTG